MSPSEAALWVLDGDVNAPAGNLMLIAGGGVEVLRFEPNGDCYVRGELVANNREVYEAFVAWLAGCTNRDLTP